MLGHLRRIPDHRQRPQGAVARGTGKHVQREPAAEQLRSRTVAAAGLSALGLVATQLGRHRRMGERKPLAAASTSEKR